MIVRPSSLGQALRRLPVSPSSAAGLLASGQALLDFRAVVQQVFPNKFEQIWSARDGGGTRENARVWAFLQQVEAGLFPVYECEQYEQVLAGIPFVREGWSYDDFHNLDLPAGHLLLLALCEQPFEPGLDSRLPLLDACSALVPAALLLEVPDGGVSPALLRGQLQGTRYAAAADFAEWLWGQTGSVFLDYDDEAEISDADWTEETVRLLAEHWRLAEGIHERIRELAEWLEADPSAHFAELLSAALGLDPSLVYPAARSLYVWEITPTGLAPVAHEDGERAVALPVGAAH